MRRTDERTARDELLLVICGRVIQHRLQRGPARARTTPQTFGDPKQHRCERDEQRGPAAVTLPLAPRQPLQPRVVDTTVLENDVEATCVSYHAVFESGCGSKERTCLV